METIKKIFSLNKPSSRQININPYQNFSTYALSTHKKNRAKNIWPIPSKLSEDELEKWEWKERVGVSKKKKS